MLGQIKSINYPFYSVGSFVINLESLEFKKFPSKIKQITSNSIIFNDSLLFAMQNRVIHLKFHEMVLDFNGTKALVQTKLYNLNYEIDSVQVLIDKLLMECDVEILDIKDTKYSC